MKTKFFQSCGHSWVFHNCWYRECNSFITTSFGILNITTVIPSLPLALFIMMLPKNCFSWHWRMSGFRWVITPSWLPRSWKSFLYSSLMYCYHLLLISFASVRSISFLFFFVPIFCMKSYLCISDFLEEISSLSHSIFDLYLFALIA